MFNSLRPLFAVSDGLAQGNNYRPDIDGLRAVAVMAVVLHHLSASLVPGGFIGVDVFFVISGYLITKIIHREIQEGNFTFSRFYERRIRRLFPALFAVLAFVMIAGWFILLPSDYMATARAAGGTLVFAANIVFWRDLAEGYFAADARLNPLLHMWSLGVEEQFYLLFPVSLILIHRYARASLTPLLLAAFLFSLGLSVLLTPVKPVAAYFLLPARGWELLAGGLLAILAVPQPGWRLWRELLAGSALLAIVVPAILYNESTPFPGYAALLPAIGTAVLIWLGGGPLTGVGRLLSLRPVVYIGLISYSLYLWHWPLIVFARFLNGLESIRSFAPLILVASLIIASLSHHFIEKPFRRGRPADGPRTFYVGATVLAGVLLLVAVSAAVSGGAVGRYPAEIVAVDALRHSEVPYKSCEARLGSRLDTLCVLGDESALPDTLLWGDSHMLAWAPGMDRALKELGRSAYFAPNSACPPILDVDQSTDPLCRTQNKNLIDALLRAAGEGRNLHVVISGFWKKYFNDSNLILSSDKAKGRNQDIASRLFPVTISRLERAGINVTVMGPVPDYSVDVPFAIAAGKSEKLERQYADVASGNEYAVLSGTHGFVDVAAWFCKSRCVVQVRGKGVLYRDSNHLSVNGALLFKEDLKRMLANPGAGVNG